VEQVLFALQDTADALSLKFGIGSGFHAEVTGVKALGEPKENYSSANLPKMVREIVCW